MAWMHYDLVGGGSSVFVLPSSLPRFKKCKRLLHAGLNAKAIESYWPLMASEALEMVRGFSESPHLLESHIRKSVPLHPPSSGYC